MPPDLPDSGGAPASAPSIEQVYERLRAIGEENKRLVAELRAGQDRFRHLAKAVWQVQEDERRRLARELHDGIGQVLTALKNHLQWIGESSSEGVRPEDLEQAIELTAQALGDTRQLSRLLRPAVLDDLGLEAALRWLARTAGKGSEPAIRIETEGLRGDYGMVTETALFRVAQEAVSNAVKHAGATRVEIAVRQEGGSLSMTVSDDGRGFDAARVARAEGRAGVGLRGMRDRVELLDGSFRVRSWAGEGSRIEVRLPAAEGEGAS